ncbi:MAG: 2-oxoacid:acceptor oxidoreductase family protein [Calditrichota bacterium]
MDVIIDSCKIQFTRTTAIDFMLCLAQRSWDKFGHDLKDNCIVLIDPFLVHEVDERYRVFRLPLVEMTKKELGKVVYTSAVSLGAMIGLTSVLNSESVEKALLDKAPKGTEEQNRKAFHLGYQAGRELLLAGVHR